MEYYIELLKELADEQYSKNGNRDAMWKFGNKRSLEDIKNVEDSLGVKFPSSLVEYYTELGDGGPIENGRLYRLMKLKSVNQHLIDSDSNILYISNYDFIGLYGIIIRGKDYGKVIFDGDGFNDVADTFEEFMFNWIIDY